MARPGKQAIPASMSSKSRGINAPVRLLCLLRWRYSRANCADLLSTRGEELIKGWKEADVRERKWNLSFPAAKFESIENMISGSSNYIIQQKSCSAMARMTERSQKRCVLELFKAASNRNSYG